MTGRADSAKTPPGENVLVLVRHGESEWNRSNRFTGWKDVGLTDEGMAEAHLAGAILKKNGIRFDCAFTSTLKRAHNTLDIIIEELDQRKLATVKAAALNERDYASLSASTKRRRASAGDRSKS